MINDNSGKQILKGLIREFLSEEAENPVVKNVKAQDNFDDFVNKPENVGQPFTRDEIDILQTLDIKPDESSATQIKYSATEQTNGNNKQMVVIKKLQPKPVFVALCCPDRRPVNLSADDVDVASAVSPTPAPQPEKVEKDTIIIKISRPINPRGDEHALFNFVNYIVKELNIK